MTDFNIQDYAAFATIAALLVSMISIAFSAWRYLGIRAKEQERERFETFHRLLKLISLGRDDSGPLKLVSQIAYIYELEKYPEYKASSIQCLRVLREEWGTGESGRKKDILSKSIDEVISNLESWK